MKRFRVALFPLLLAFALLYAQQVGAVHALHHALESLAQQHESKQAPHSGTCEQCAAYAQLGSALNVGAYDFIPLPVSGETILHRSIFLHSAFILASVARGPPHPNQIA